MAKLVGVKKLEAIVQEMLDITRIERDDYKITMGDGDGDIFAREMAAYESVLNAIKGLKRDGEL